MRAQAVNPVSIVAAVFDSPTPIPWQGLEETVVETDLCSIADQLAFVDSIDELRSSGVLTVLDGKLAVNADKAIRWLRQWVDATNHPTWWHLRATVTNLMNRLTLQLAQQMAI